MYSGAFDLIINQMINIKIVLQFEAQYVPMREFYNDHK